VVGVIYTSGRERTTTKRREEEEISDDTLPLGFTNTTTVCKYVCDVM
jgi:hypothetical protein